MSHVRAGARNPGDIRPAERLVEELRYERAQGSGFDDVFDLLVVLVLDECGYDREERRFWSKWLNQTRETWRACYDRVPAGMTLTRELVSEDREQGHTVLVA
jgi:hypothetical protein